ncbi:Fur family transcriptional regulator [Demequina sp.]|uniref:Fur family transcriptional regulator n=1 Tax=Demequina sp. TaxID=2050685 RepID=UPI0025D4D217|nr:Fur family transcriptional regulator [Demequina sp.]
MTATRKTKQRTAILAALEEGEFRSAQAWHERLRADGSSVGLATVYRALQALVETGDVDAVVNDGGEMLYRRCQAREEHHHHLRCRVCGRAVEIAVPFFEDFVAGLVRDHGYADIQHTIELTGVCPDCAARGER